MAQLPPDGDWLIQQIDGEVVLFHRYLEDEPEVVRFNPSDMDEVARAQYAIYRDRRLTAEQKCFGHFWSGYFYAYADADPGEDVDDPQNTEERGAPPPEAD